MQLLPFSCFLLAFCLCVSARNSIDPAVLIPGLSASALYDTEAFVDARRWVNEIELKDGSFKDKLKVVWDPTINFLYSDKTIEPYDNLEGVSNIAGEFAEFKEDFVVFGDVASAIQNSSSTPRGAPYDWRLAPQQDIMAFFFNDLEKAIMNLYTEYRGTYKVWLIAHSLGNLMTLKWLDYITSTNPAFLTQYVAGYIATSAPVLGAGLGLQAPVFGVQEHGIPIPSSLLGNFACFPWVYPSYSGTIVEWGPNHVYTAATIGQFINAFPFDSNQAEIYNYFVQQGYFNYPLNPPGLAPSQVHYFYSENVPTAVGIKYTASNGWFAVNETSLPYGDGTVPYNSLIYPAQYWNLPIENIHFVGNVSHSGILQDPKYLTDVIQILGGIASPGTV